MAAIGPEPRNKYIEPSEHEECSAKIKLLRSTLERLHDFVSASNDWRPDSRLGRDVLAALKSTRIT